MSNGISDRITNCLLLMAVLVGLVSHLSANPSDTNTAQGSLGSDGNNAGVLPPDSTYGGLTYSDWSQQWWLWAFAVPADQNPTTTNGDAPCQNGQRGLWFLIGLSPGPMGPKTINCTVPRGTPLLIPIINSECSNLEPPPYHGGNKAKRRACAKAWMDNVHDLSATVDGVSIKHLTHYRFQTEDFSFWVPDNNILGVNGSTVGSSSADGYYILLLPLSPGTHTIHVAGTTDGPGGGVPGFTIDGGYELTVL